MVVIGLGAMGAATLCQLARRGVGTLGIDRFSPPHAFGSSHGDTRITRCAIGEGEDYVPLARRSHEIWRELEVASGRHLLAECGGLVIGPLESPVPHHAKPDFLRRTIDLAQRFDIPHELLDRQVLARRFPQFTGLEPDDMAYYEPGAGFLYVERCIAAQLAEARRRGARLLTNTRVHAVQQRGDAVRLDTAAGPVDAGRVVVAAGAWTAPLLGPPFDRLLRVTRQVMHWFGAEDRALYDPSRCPIFIRMHGDGGGDFFYGFPVAAGTAGVKVGSEQYEVETAAERVDRAVQPAEAERMYDRHIAGRLAGVSAQTPRSVACLYTSTAGSRFLIDTHPRMSRVLVVSACSGHGFKHSAAIGEAVAQQVTAGRSALDLGAFRLQPFDLPD